MITSHENREQVSQRTTSIPSRKAQELYRTQQTCLGLSKTATLTTPFHGITFLLTHPTTGQVQDVISVLERNF